MKILHELMAPYSHYHMDHFLALSHLSLQFLQQCKSHRTEDFLCSGYTGSSDRFFFLKKYAECVKEI